MLRADFEKSPVLGKHTVEMYLKISLPKSFFFLFAAGLCLHNGCGSCRDKKKKETWAVEKVELTAKRSFSKKIEEPPLLRKFGNIAKFEHVSELDEPFVFGWPLEDLDITSPYGHRMHPIVGTVLFHRGVDLAAPRGTPVMSTGPGIVEFAGDLPLTGKTVIISHPGGYQSLYAHLEEIMVWEEMVLDKGAPLGLIGSTGRSTGPHLHFQFNKNSESVDPGKLLGTVIDPDESNHTMTSVYEDMPNE